MTRTLPTVSYGDITVDFNTVPDATVTAILSRGLTHFLGNEQASKVASKFKDATPEEATDEAKAAYRAECVAKAVEALNAGTIGVRAAAGPKATPLDTIKNRIAEQEVKAILAANGLKMPKGDKVVEFSDGTKLTRAELIARRLAKPEENARITKLAEAEMKKAGKIAEGVGVDALL